MIFLGGNYQLMVGIYRYMALLWAFSIAQTIMTIASHWGSCRSINNYKSHRFLLLSCLIKTNLQKILKEQIEDLCSR